jgi:hypothetical protein
VNLALRKPRQFFALAEMHLRFAMRASTRCMSLQSCTTARPKTMSSGKCSLLPAKAVFLCDSNRFGQGSMPARLMKLALYKFGFWLA